MICRKHNIWKFFALSVFTMLVAGSVNAATTSEIQQKIQQAERDYQADKTRLDQQIANARQAIQDFDGYRPEIRAKVTERQTLRNRIAELESSPNGRRYAFLEIRRLQDQVDDLTNDIVGLRRQAEERTRTLNTQLQNAESELQQRTQAYEQYIASLEQELQKLSG